MPENIPPKNIPSQLPKSYRTKRERRNSALMKVAESFGTKTITSSLEDFIARANAEDKSPRQTWDFSAPTAGAQTLKNTDAALKKLRADQTKITAEKKALSSDLQVAVTKAKEAEKRAQTAEIKLSQLGKANAKQTPLPKASTQKAPQGFPLKTAIISLAAGGLLMFGITKLGNNDAPKEATPTVKTKASPAALNETKRPAAKAPVKTQAVAPAPAPMVKTAPKKATSTEVKQSVETAMPQATAVATERAASKSVPQPSSVEPKKVPATKPKGKTATATKTPKPQKKTSIKKPKKKASPAKKKAKKPKSGLVNPF